MGEAHRAQRPGARMARRREQGRQENGIGADAVGPNQRFFGVRRRRQERAPFPAPVASTPLREMQSAGSNPLRQPPVATDQEGDPSAPTETRYGLCQVLPTRRAIVTEDDATPRRKGGNARERVAAAAFIGDEPEAGNARPFEVARVLC